MQTIITNPRITTQFAAVASCIAAAFICGCAATSVSNTWKSPEAVQPVSKVAVLTVDDRGLLRQGFENRLAAELTKAGCPAVATFDQLSLAAIKEDRKAAADHFIAKGADSVLILRLADVGTSYHESQAGRGRYTGAVEGMDWYGFYSMSFMNMTPTYGNLKQTVYLEAGLFELATGKRLWAGVTQSVLEEHSDRMAEMDPIAAKIIAAMMKDGVIR